MADGSVVSRRTIIVAVVGIVLSLGFYALKAFGVGDEATQTLFANIGNVTIQCSAAVFVLWAATRFSRGVPLRFQWTFIGLGVLAFGLASVVWGYYEVVLGQEIPFPGPPDIGYTLQYPLYAIGLFAALAGFRKLFDLKVPLAISGVVAILATAALYFSLITTILADESTDAIGKFLSILYPVADIWCILLPALAVGLTVSRMGAGRLAWPWWGATTAAVLLVVADTFWAVTYWAGTYETGNWVDLAWYLGFSTMAFAASLLLDVQLPRKAASAASSAGGES